MSNKIILSFKFSLLFFIFFNIPQTALVLEGFLLPLYRIGLVCQDFPLPPTCLDLPRLA